MRQLKNPGPESPKMLEFDEIPSLFEFLANGGMPGVEYLYTIANNMPKAQTEGWEQINRVPFFTIRGLGCALMARGKPLLDTPAQPGTVKCKTFCDDAILVALGQLPSTEQLQPETPVLSPSVKHTKTDAALLTVK